MNVPIIFILLIFLCYMFSIKEFNDLPLPVKSIVITVMAIMPFWFLILWLYFPVFADLEWYKSLLFCFVPSSVWYLLGLASNFIIMHRLDLDLEELSEDKFFWISIALDLFLYLILIGLACFLFRVPFGWFIGILFGLKILVIFSSKTIAKAFLDGDY